MATTAFITVLVIGVVDLFASLGYASDGDKVTATIVLIMGVFLTGLGTFGLLS